MITLAFLVCSALNGQCFSASPELVFTNPTQCELFAEMVIIENQRKVDVGEMFPHITQYKCIDWGRPT
jgi:hypothetical protein